MHGDILGPPRPPASEILTITHRLGISTVALIVPVGREEHERFGGHQRDQYCE